MDKPIRVASMLVIALSVLAGCAGGNWNHSSDRSQREGALQVPNAPAVLRAQPGQVLTLVANGTGVQIYTCKVSQSDPSRFEWKFKAPEADLSDAHGKSIGKHYAGPTWEADDGSKVIGQVNASSNESDPNSIPALLLNAVSNSGSGVFAKTTSIQRLYPVGGKAPLVGCDQGHLGQEARVSYTAQYYFYD